MRIPNALSVTFGDSSPKGGAKDANNFCRKKDSAAKPNLTVAIPLARACLKPS